MDFNHVLNNQLFPVSFCVVLPLILALLYYRNKKHSTDKRTEIVLCAIEKNSDLDVKEFMQALTPVQKPLSERLILRLHWELAIGSSLTIGAGSFILFCIMAMIYCSITIGHIKDDFLYFIFLATPLLAIGIGLLVAYRMGKKVLAQLKDK